MNRPPDFRRVMRISICLLVIAASAASSSLIWTNQPAPKKTHDLYDGRKGYPPSHRNAIADYHFFLYEISSTAVVSLRPRCTVGSGEQFTFLWLSRLSGVLVNGQRRDDLRAPMWVTGYVLTPPDWRYPLRVSAQHIAEIPAWDWSAVTNAFQRVFAPGYTASKPPTEVDGVGWYLEWCNNGHYGFVYRNTPEVDDDEHELTRLGGRLARISQVNDVFGLTFRVEIDE